MQVKKIFSSFNLWSFMNWQSICGHWNYFLTFQLFFCVPFYSKFFQLNWHIINSLSLEKEKKNKLTRNWKAAKFISSLKNSCIAKGQFYNQGFRSFIWKHTFSFFKIIQVILAFLSYSACLLRKINTISFQI